MDYHCDQTDAVALLCIRTAKSGGTSKVASSVRLRSEVLRRRPDLHAVLTRPFCCRPSSGRTTYRVRELAGARTQAGAVAAVARDPGFPRAHPLFGAVVARRRRRKHPAADQTGLSGVGRGGDPVGHAFLRRGERRPAPQNSSFLPPSSFIGWDNARCSLALLLLYVGRVIRVSVTDSSRRK